MTANLLGSAIPRQAQAPTERLVWSSTKSGTVLCDGKPMSAAEALQYARAGAHGNRDFVQHSPTHITWTSGLGPACSYIGNLPVPDDPHAAARDLAHDLICDAPLSIVQGDLLIRALTAASDSTCPDCPVCAPLRQLIATTVRA